MAVHYYQEFTGDYLALDGDAVVRACPRRGAVQWEGRATAVPGQPATVRPCLVGVSYLSCCRPVPAGELPPEWRRAFGLEQAG